MNTSFIAALQEDGAKRKTNAVAAEPRKSRVLIVDDHPIFRIGLSAVINAEPDLLVCCEASSSSFALEGMRKGHPDLAILEVSLRGTNGIELTKALKAERPDLPILIVSMHDESRYALRTLRAGALGYVTKSAPVTDVLTALRRVLKGKIYVGAEFLKHLTSQAVQSTGWASGSEITRLSPKELEVFRLFGRGFGTKDVASELSLSTKTIETHRVRIKKKLGFTNAKEMVRYAIDWFTQDKAA